MPQTRLATRYAPSPLVSPVADATALEKIAATTKTKTNVAIISLSKLAPVLRIAGAVQKQARFRLTSGVSFQCGRNCSQTKIAPTKAPSICAGMYDINLE